MGDLVSDNWKVFPGLIMGAFVVGLVAMVFIRDRMRKWLLNGDVQNPCSVPAGEGTPLSKEDHEEMCEKQWADHTKISAERWAHNQEIAKKDRELLMSEVEHLKHGQEKMGKTVDKIFERLDRRNNL